MLESCLRELGVPEHYPYFEDYWSEPTRYPFVISAASRVAGFALIRRLNSTGELEMAEFYVAPEFRRAGIGRIAARALFAKFPGEWRIAVLRSNKGGALFWPRVVPGTSRPQIEDGRMVFSFSTNAKNAT